MEPLAFTDPSKFPSDEIISSHIGKYNEHWNDLLKRISEKFSGSAGEWRYYKDGGSWLFKMVHKKKTLFWTAVFSDSFNITFYFGDKAEKLVGDSDIPAELKEQYFTGKRFGKIRAITFKVCSISDVDNALLIAEIKSKV